MLVVISSSAWLFFSLSATKETVIHPECYFKTIDNCTYWIPLPLLLYTYFHSAVYMLILKFLSPISYFRSPFIGKFSQKRMNLLLIF